MADRFGIGTIDIMKAAACGTAPDDTEERTAERITDFSRIRSVLQRSADGADGKQVQPEQESGQPDDDVAAQSGDRESCLSRLQELDSRVKYFETKLHEMRRLQEDLRKVETEREELSARLGEIEEQNIQSEEDLKNILSEKREIEERNQALQSANEEALNRIRTLTQEKEDAVLGENEAIEKYLRQLKENDDLSAEISSLRSINEKLNEEMDREYKAAQYAAAEPAEPVGGQAEEPFEFGETPVSEIFDEKYGQELATDSGRELFLMLRGLLQDDARDDNGVRLTKLWEEELEETIPGAYPDEPPITRKVRTKSEVSVEYIAGHKNGI